jgi:hypothetical protein
MAGELVPSDFTHGYYEFAGQVSNEIVDLSDAGFNLAVNGAIDVLTGKFNNGLEFDGINDTATSAQSRFADLTDQLGVCGWIHLLRTATGVDGYVWKGANSSGNQDFVFFGVNDTKGWFRVNDGGTQALTDNMGTVNPFFFAMNYDGVNATVFWDDPGVNSNSISKTGNIRDTGPLNLGSETGNIDNANIRFSQLGIRNAPFTSDELAFMYKGGAGRLLTAAVAAPAGFPFFFGED